MFRPRLVAAAGVLAVALLSPITTSPATGSDAGALAPGSVVDSWTLPEELSIPGVTGAAYGLEYSTTNARGEQATSTGALFLPEGDAPAGGWPVVSWAHGTVGIADHCAPSRLPRTARDASYLATWMREGYAVVATDYTGLGTAGVHTYLEGRSSAHSIVDIVRAGRELAATTLPAGQQLAERWVAIGQSQGGGAAVYAARWATEFGGPALDYRGAVGTGTPAHIENIVGAIGPNVPPVSPSSAYTAFLAYIFAGLHEAHPELGLDTILTDTGRRVLEQARTLCFGPFVEQLAGVSPGQFFARTPHQLPNYRPTLASYLGMPTKGFDKPFFMAHGLIDTTVPIVGTAGYFLELTLARQPVTFRTYPSDHSGTMAASLPDTVPFVRRLMG